MRYVPLKKQGKKAQAKHHDQLRGSWDGVMPVTRIMPDKKNYERCRAKQMDQILRNTEA